jgi:hypothetical protein
MPDLATLAASAGLTPAQAAALVGATTADVRRLLDPKQAELQQRLEAALKPIALQAQVRERMPAVAKTILDQYDEAARKAHEQPYNAALRERIEAVRVVMRAVAATLDGRPGELLNELGAEKLLRSLASAPVHIQPVITARTPRHPRQPAANSAGSYDREHSPLQQAMITALRDQPRAKTELRILLKATPQAIGRSLRHLLDAGTVTEADGLFHLAAEA